MDAVCNTEKKARVRNLVYAGDRVRKMRMSYLDTPGMQVMGVVDSLAVCVYGIVFVISYDLNSLNIRCAGR